MTRVMKLLEALNSVAEMEEALCRSEIEAERGMRLSRRQRAKAARARNDRTEFHVHLYATLIVDLAEEAPNALAAAVEAEDLNSARDALNGLAVLGESADIEAGGVSLLATAIGERRSVTMMELLVAHSCVHRWRHDKALWTALQAHPVDAWREAIEALLSKAMAADGTTTGPCQLCCEG